jgi:hypothetical protein
MKSKARRATPCFAGVTPFLIARSSGEWQPGSDSLGFRPGAPRSPSWSGRRCGLPPSTGCPPVASLRVPVSPLVAMALLPRWRFMSEEAKALTKRSALSIGLVLVALLLVRALVPWLVLALVLWWGWRWFSR